MDLTGSDFLKATPPMPVVLLSTLHGEVKNAAPYAWHMPISMAPPLLGVAIRKTRDTFKNIMDTGEFVVCIPPPSLKDKVILTAKALPRDRSEFELAGLTPIRSRKVAPFGIGECPANLECRLVWSKEAGDHHVVVGEVLHASVSEELGDADGIRWPEPLLHIGGGRNLYAGIGDLL
ncbi:MAG: flavin reductase family protein [Thermoplasmatota archaeon]